MAIDHLEDTTNSIKLSHFVAVTGHHIKLLDKVVVTCNEQSVTTRTNQVWLAGR